MSQSLLSVLCECWAWPVFTGCSIQFKQNGTGNLLCGVGQAIFIIAEFDWKPLGDSSAALQQAIDFSSDFQVTINMELTLTTRLSPELQHVQPDQVNEANLTKAAFEPKSYKVQISKGRFTADDWLFFSGDTKFVLPDDDLWYGLRLLFDKSPYPPLDEWVEEREITRRAVKANRFWECKDLYKDTEESTVKITEEDEERWEEKRREIKERMRAGRPE